MATYTKGDQSREEIVKRSREIFNEHGIHLTFSNLVHYLDTTMGRITYHFRNKELLFVAIVKEYEKELMEMRMQRQSDQIGFDQFIQSVARVMDLQFEYRCALRYVISSLQHQDDMKMHLVEAYKNNRTSIYKTMQTYVDAGSLHPKVLNDDTYEVFLFQITNLFTTWVINLELYDSNRPYAEVKPIYLRGMIATFLPFLTEKGKRELHSSGLYQS